MDSAIVAAADHAARHWSFGQGGAAGPGEDAAPDDVQPDAARHLQPLQAGGHRMAACSRSRHAQRLVTLPIWDIAVQTEGTRQAPGPELCPHRARRRCCARRSS